MKGISPYLSDDVKIDAIVHNGTTSSYIEATSGEEVAVAVAGIDAFVTHYADIKHFKTRYFINLNRS